MSRVTIGFKLSPNAEGWCRPWHRRTGASFVKDFGYAAEDWNFAVDQSIDGWVYGYTQGFPRQDLRDGQPFDLLFYVYESGCGYRAVGLYLGASFLEPEEAKKAAKTPGWAMVLERRQDQIKSAYGRKDWERVWSNYSDVPAPFNWRVRPEGVVTLSDKPVFTPPYRATRDGTPYYFRGATWEKLLNVPLSTPDEDGVTTVEGRVRLVTHRQRERDLARAARVKRHRMKQHGKLTCDACGWNFGARFGKKLADLLEAHHTRPLQDLEQTGEAVKDQDIALLCPNCHRLAHRTGHVDLPSLQDFLSRNGTTP